MYFDIFNGDADGLCGLHMLRLAEPRDAELVTGVKRDIALLKRIEAEAGDEVTVLDIAVEKNAGPLAALLGKGVDVVWFDHHNPGELPVHPNFKPHIDTAAEVCTSLIVDRLLAGRYRAWAVAAAYGDNLHDSARRSAEPLGLDAARIEALRELGECLNYNGYGETLADLHFPPDRLYERLHAYADPFSFIAEAPEFARLRAGYAEDMTLARAVAASEHWPAGAVFILPDAAWARRASGVYANELANANPERAHALLTRTSQGDFTVSIRAPLANRVGADELCRRFGGGGRKAAAGINALPAARLEDLTRAFRAQFAAPVRSA